VRASWELSCSTVSVPGETGEEWVRGGSEFLCVCVCVRARVVGPDVAAAENDEEY